MDQYETGNQAMDHYETGNQAIDHCETGNQAMDHSRRMFLVDYAFSFCANTTVFMGYVLIISFSIWFGRMLVFSFE